MNKIAKVAGIGTILASSAFISATHVNNTKMLSEGKNKKEQTAVSKPQKDNQVMYIWNNGNSVPQNRESNGSELPFAITTAMAGGVITTNRFKVNQRDKNGNTPLHNALKELHTTNKDYKKEYCSEKFVQLKFNDVIKIIDDEHFDVTKRDSNGSSYISKAINVDCDKEQKKIIIDKLVEKCLLSSDYDPNIENQNGETDIYVLINDGYYEHAEKLMQLDKFDSTKRYSDNKHSLLQQLTVIYYEDEVISICTSLINKNINNDKYNPNETNAYGNTDAMTLLRYGLFDDAKKVMELETFDASKRNEDGIGYIRFALRGSNINKKEFVSYVVDKVLSNPDYNPNIANKEGYTDIEHLLKNGFIEDAIKMIKDSRFDVSKNKALISKIDFKDKNIKRKQIEEFINLYIEKVISNNEYNIYATDDEGYTEMHYLARYGYLNAFGKMLRAYPYFDMSMPAKDGQTPAELYRNSMLSNEIMNNTDSSK